ncbi:HNH endonuclease [Paenibacillaceae bacterium]|nr:HNH endonuclease [Paenibacillaceae bacterium]
MPVGELRSVPKPKFKRSKKTAKQRGKVSADVYAEALERSGARCERCGKGGYQVWTLEGAHAQRRWKYGQEGVRSADIIMLCGPQTQSGTCHHWADSTTQGRAWLLSKRDEFRSDGREFLEWPENE